MNLRDDELLLFTTFLFIFLFYCIKGNVTLHVLICFNILRFNFSIKMKIKLLQRKLRKQERRRGIVVFAP